MITEAFRDKLDAWPKIGPKDSKGLRQFADFLQQCQAAMTDIRGLEVLNDCRENRRLLQKLPDWLAGRWGRVVARLKGPTDSFPRFSEFVKFVKDEATIACDPITSLTSLRGNSEKERDKPTRSAGARTFTTGGREEGTGKAKCAFCRRDNHQVQECKTLAGKPLMERQEFVKSKELCFGCLGHGHQAKFCKQRSVCKSCKGKHPTSLHEERNFKRPNSTPTKDGTTKKSPNPFTTEATARSFCGLSSNNIDSMSSMVVPVWIADRSSPDEEHLVYALLDSQSDTTFVLGDTADSLYKSQEVVR
ncbi:uncharacterized protein LOC135491624 [Lineus longissimus]|uniref:uncharacterized protein LOC135491624 n=1 Tax=Lineus longissimus TaxID=88925 RepID=UPI00315D10CD